MKKPCNDCPFKKETPLVGSPEWLKDVVNFHIDNPFFSHSCHKTDPKADGWNGKSKEPGDCAGHLQMIMNDLDSTPGKAGVYESIHELANAYVVHYEKEFARRKEENGGLTLSMSYGPKP